MHRSRGPIPALATGLLAVTTALAAPSIQVKERRSVVLTVRSLSAVAPDAPPDGHRLELASGKAASAQFEVLWPGDGERSLVSLVAIPRPPTGSDHTIRLDAEVRLPGGERVGAARDLVFSDSTTALFEVARSRERSLTLVVAAEEVLETVLTSRPEAGVPVVLGVEVEWLEQGQSTPLESNRLSTFVGEEVAYSFRLGETGVAEALEVRLLPLGIFGELIQVRAEVTGSIPREGRLELVSRSEQWMISRGQSSTLDLAAGEPKTGFRFVVTPRF